LGQSPLHYAAKLGKNKILELLIAESQNPSSLIDKSGYYPLDYALAKGEIFTAVILLESGIKNSKYQNNYDKAFKANHSKKINSLKIYIDLLEQAQEIVAKHLTESYNVTIMSESLAHDLSDLDILGETPLHDD